MKKIFILLICLLLLIGCETESVHQGKRIALVISSRSNPFFESIVEYSEFECEKLGYELVVLDSQNDLKLESEHFDEIDAFDVVILNPVEGEGSSEHVIKANQIGVPIITLDRSVERGKVVTHIASDNYSGGRLAGEFIESVIRPEDKLLLVEGIVDTTANKRRVDGINDYLREVDIVIDQTIVANFNRQEAYELTVGLDLDDIDLVFAANDEMALGVLDAMREKNSFAVIVGFDGTDQAMQAIKSGYIAATVAQQPNLLAKHSIEAVEKILNDETVEEEIYVALKLVSLLIK